MDRVHIRKFKSQDAEEVCKLVVKTFNEFVSRDFSKKGIKKFLGEQTAEKQAKRAKKRVCLVAIANNRIIGFAEGNKGRITRFFVNKKYHNKGIGKGLMRNMEKFYKNKGYRKIGVHSSLYAVPFYGKAGYKKSGNVIRKDGFAYQPMKKSLDYTKK